MHNVIPFTSDANDHRIANYIRGVKAVVFDWDDTLVDSKTGNLAQNRDLAEKFGVTRSEEEVEALYRNGIPLPDMLVELCDHTATFEEIWQEAKKDYSKPEYSKRLIDGAEQSVRTLQGLGCHTLLFTATSRDALKMDIANTGFDPGVFGNQLLHVPQGIAKSDPRAFSPVMGWLTNHDISHRDALYVGDGLGDMSGAIAAEMKFLGVEQGFVSHDEFTEHGALSVPNTQKLAAIAIILARNTN